MADTPDWVTEVLPLFAPRPTPAPVRQDVELKRVLSGIGEHVHSFLLAHVGESFHMKDLTDYVQARAQCSPDSPRRVMGELKKQGWAEVILVSRSASLYRVISVEHRKESEG